MDSWKEKFKQPFFPSSNRWEGSKNLQSIKRWLLLLFGHVTAELSTLCKKSLPDTPAWHREILSVPGKQQNSFLDLNGLCKNNEWTVG